MGVEGSQVIARKMVLFTTALAQFRGNFNFQSFLPVTFAVKVPNEEAPISNERKT